MSVDALNDDDWCCNEETIRKLQNKYAKEEFPLFMDTIPKSIDGNVHLEALQCLLYDEHTPEERAFSFKEQGNMHFEDAMKSDNKKDKLKKAALCYSEGIKQDCSNNTLNSLLFSNRAHVHFLLRDFVNCLNDCREGIRLDASNIKSYFRAAKASYCLELLNESEMFCVEGLKQQPENEHLLKLHQSIQEKKKEKLEKKKVYEATSLEEKERDHRRLMEALAERGLTLLSHITYDIPLSPSTNVVIDPQGNLHWTCILLIPEYNVSEAIVDFEENSCWLDHLSTMFPEEGPFAFWDTEREYVASHLAVYYEGREDSQSDWVCRVPLDVSLKVILSSFREIPPSPVFVIVVYLKKNFVRCTVSEMTLCFAADTPVDQFSHAIFTLGLHPLDSPRNRIGRYLVVTCVMHGFALMLKKIYVLEKHKGTLPFSVSQNSTKGYVESAGTKTILVIGFPIF